MLISSTLSSSPGRASPKMQSFPAVPSNTDSASSSSSNPMAKINLQKLGKMLPTSNFSAIVAICSVTFTFIVSLCLCCRRCRKRGRGESSDSDQR